MRSAIVAAILVMAGCIQGVPQEEQEHDPDAAIREPLPPPRSSIHEENMGLSAIDDITGTVPASPWAQECVRHWRSGGYTAQHAPVIAGRPCWFLPTEEGTLFWHVVDFDGEARFGVPAGPIPRDDGFFDWAVFDQPSVQEAGGVLSLYMNGSAEPLVTWPEMTADPRNGVSAVWVGDTVHVLLGGWSYLLDIPGAGSAGGTGAFYHAWWRPGQEPQWESRPSGSVFNDHTWRVGPGGAYAIGALAAGPVTNTVYVASGGAMTALPPVAGSLYDVIEGPDALHACVTIGNTYQHAWMPLVESGTVPVWLYEPITTGLLAQLAFTCDITYTDDGLVVIIDSPAAMGDGPNPLAGSYAFTRTAPGDWERLHTGFSFWNGDDLVTTAGRPYHIGQTGNGTSNGDPKCGVEVRTPVAGKWQMVFCNHHGDWSYGLDTGTHPTLVASAMINPPFETWYSRSDGDGRAMTSVALVLPPPGFETETGPTG